MINPKLALIFAKFAKDHGHKILQANNADLLARDLGDALKRQKQVLSDPNRNVLFTAYDVLPLILEVKVLTAVTANRMGVAAKGKSDIQVLEGIIAAGHARKNGAVYVRDIEATLEWTRRLFSHPEIQSVLSMEMTAIEAPKNPRDVMKFIIQLAGRSQDELSRLSEFLRTAKNLDDLPPAPETRPAAHKAEEPAAPKKKPAPRKKPGTGKKPPTA
jgi:hypothetical protein